MADTKFTESITNNTEKLEPELLYPRLMGVKRWYHNSYTHDGIDVDEFGNPVDLITEARKYAEEDLAYFFGDEVTYQYVRANIEYEIAKMENYKNETMRSCQYFRQSLSSYCIWMMIMNSKIRENEISHATTIKAIIDRFPMAKATANTHLKVAVESGWAVKFKATSNIASAHWHATELCMSEYLARLKLEEQILPVKKYITHSTFNAFQKHMRTFYGVEKKLDK